MKTDSAISSISSLRHVGDLGNIKQSADGLVSTHFVDQVISLEGSNNVVGRSLVVSTGATIFI